MSFKKPLYEAPGDAFAKMSDDQFADYQKKNPGSAQKAARVRKQAQARAAKKSGSPQPAKSTTNSTPSGKKEVGTSALAKRGGLVKTNSQGNQSNKVGGSGGSKRMSSAGGKAVDMGVKKVKVRDVTPGQKKISGSPSSSSSSSGGQKKLSGSGGAGGNRRPPSGAGTDRVAQGGALAKRAPEKKTGGPTNYTAKKNYVKAKRVASKVGAAARVAGKVAGAAGKIGKFAVGNTAAAFGKSSWKTESTDLKTFKQFMAEAKGV